MLVLFPALALGVFVGLSRARLPCWQEAILCGAVVWGVLLIGMTELLSSMHALTLAGLSAGWLVVLLVGLGLLGARKPAARVALPGGGLSWQRLRHLPMPSECWSALGAIVMVLGLIVVVNPPNNWDSMTYHMARLIHWQQNASLAPYPTHILRQLYLQPGAEFVLLHLQILSGGDHLAGCVQLASLLGVVLGVRLIAGDLGAHRSGGVCAGIFAAAVPIGILESTSTQNDYVVSFWLVCTFVFGLRLMRARGEGVPWLLAALFGASLGLALLTKATAYLVVLPMLVWVAFGLFGRRGWRGLGVLVGAGALALALNLGFFARNLTVFGSPLGPPDEGAPSLRYFNAAFSPALLASNVVRDVGLNAIATPFPSVNVRGVSIVRAVHAWLGVDMADPRTTWGEERFKEQPVGLAFDENFASNPLQVLLIVATLAAIWPLRRRLRPWLVVYASVLTTGFLLFCAILRWQPWHTRLELAFFVLAGPMVGVVVERLSHRLAVMVAGLLLVSMLPWVVYNQASPLVGPRGILGGSRDNEYFTNQPTLRSAYLGGVSFLAERGCGRIGFLSSADGWEYPLWPLLDESMPGGVEIEHVGVTNISAGLTGAGQRGFEPCAVFSVTPDASARSLDLDGRTYIPAWAQAEVSVLTPDGR